MDITAQHGQAGVVEGGREVASRLAAAGHRALWAGGCVRDRLLGRPFKDIDLATGAPPAEVLRLFPGSTAVGRAFGVVAVRRGAHTYEVATFRRDLAYADGRRPDGVVFTGEREDALRRDFTVNGLFYDPATGEVFDYVGGRADLAARRIRTIGAPSARFREDYLRMLRAVRFAAVLAFDLDPGTAAGIREHAPLIAGIPAERVRTELTRMLTESPAAGRGLRLLRETGLLRVILPEVDAMAGQEQPPAFHPEGDVFEHTARMLDLLPGGDAVLAYAALLHDVGKPPTARRCRDADGAERIRFDGHDRVGAELAERILLRLRLPRRAARDVVHAVAGHMRFMHVRDMRESTLRRLVGAPTYPLERALHRLDCLASHGDLSHLEFLDRFEAERSAEPVLPPPLADGRDIMALGVPEGPEVGRLRGLAYERQLQHPEAGREDLLAWLAARVAAERAGPGGGSPGGR